MQRVRSPLVGMRLDGGLLHRLRINAGITQEEIAERAKISVYWYRLIEKHGQQPSLPVTQSIADAGGWDLDQFCVPVEDAAA